MPRASYVSGTSAEPLLGETIDDNFDRIAAVHGDVLCLIARHQNVRWTYAEFAERVDECARAFLALGVERDGRTREISIAELGLQEARTA